LPALKSLLYKKGVSILFTNPTHPQEVAYNQGSLSCKALFSALCHWHSAEEAIDKMEDTINYRPHELTLSLDQLVGWRAFFALLKEEYQEKRYRNVSWLNHCYSLEVN
jgi:hypothetical protein